MSTRRTHLSDIRLHNNAGISFPLCQVGTKALDLEKTGWKTSGNTYEVNCKHCIRMAPKRYPWALYTFT